jgi:hypothetical protein
LGAKKFVFRLIPQRNFIILLPNRIALLNFLSQLKTPPDWYTEAKKNRKLSRLFPFPSLTVIRRRNKRNKKTLPATFPILRSRRPFSGWLEEAPP